MRTEVFDDPQAVAYAAAEVIGGEAWAAVAARGSFTLAVSGGNTPWLMLRSLAARKVPWDVLHLFQVDERVAPGGDPDRNLTHIRECLTEHVPLRLKQIHAMQVDGPDLDAAVAGYIRTLRRIAGTPPVLDVVHLGLGPDGHTASLIPGDPAADVIDADVALTGIYQGKRRMTLTYPALHRARRIIWVVTGPDKREILRRLRSGDESIPAGRVRRDCALVIADQAATGQLAANAREVIEGLSRK
jgi:6-phosphogluconolactonase